MALQEYHKVDLKTGMILDVCLFDLEKTDKEGNIIPVEIPEDCFLGWGDRVFYHPYYDFELGDWAEGRPLEDILEEHRSVKDRELNQACMDAILAGFDHEIDGTVYHFSFDTQAQFNFQGAIQLFNNGMIDSITWTVKENGEYKRIKLSKDDMDGLALAIMEHKDRNISRYRDELMLIVNNAKTIAAIEQVTW